MKFRIHAFESIRRTYEIEAESFDDAVSKIDETIETKDYIESELTGEFQDPVLIDPILPNGEVDYENARWVIE